MMVLAECASIRCVSSLVQNGNRSTAPSSTCSAVTRGGSTNGSMATQFSPHRPYFDPSVATSTFMLHILSIEFSRSSIQQSQTSREMPLLDNLARAAQCHPITEVFV